MKHIRLYLFLYFTAAMLLSAGYAVLGRISMGLSGDWEVILLLQATGYYGAAVLLPVASGVNVRLTVQLAPEAIEAGQLFDCIKSPGFVPVSEMLLIVSGAVPTFVTATVCTVVVVPSTAPLKLTLLGEKLKFGLPTMKLFKMLPVIV